MVCPCADDPLDVVAAFSDDRKTLTIAVLNPSDTEASMNLAISGTKLADHGTLWQMAPDKIDAVVALVKARGSGGREVAGPSPMQHRRSSLQRQHLLVLAACRLEAEARGCNLNLETGKKRANSDLRGRAGGVEEVSARLSSLHSRTLARSFQQKRFCAKSILNRFILTQLLPASTLFVVSGAEPRKPKWLVGSRSRS